MIFVFQKIKAVSGDKNNIIEGDPNNPCNLSGNGNSPAPSIENGKVHRIIIGIIFNPDFLQVLRSPIMKKILAIEVKTSPKVNIC